MAPVGMQIVVRVGEDGWAIRIFSMSRTEAKAAGFGYDILE